MGAPLRTFTWKGHFLSGLEISLCISISLGIGHLLLCNSYAFTTYSLFFQTLASHLLSFIHCQFLEHQRWEPQTLVLKHSLPFVALHIGCTKPVILDTSNHNLSASPTKLYISIPNLVRLWERRQCHVLVQCLQFKIRQFERCGCFSKYFFQFSSSMKLYKGCRRHECVRAGQ